MTELSTEVLSPRHIKVVYERLPVDTLMYITKSRDVLPIIDYLKTTVSLDYKEHAWVLSLTRGNRLIGISKISEGTHTNTFISQREVVQIALVTHATAVIVIHNHPSGECEPSAPDRALSNVLVKVVRLFDLILLDHIIISTESYFSMADEGLLP